MTIPRLPKLCGADVETGNFLLGSSWSGTGAEAARALLSEIEGLPRTRLSHASTSRWPAGASNRGHDQGAPGSSGIADGNADRNFSGRVHAYDSVRGGWSGSSGKYDAQDFGRKFLTNGGCAYIDLDHLEICLPETLSAHDHVACWLAMLHVVRRALAAANRKQPRGRRLQVLVNNSDGLGNSYGSHLNFLITRRAWDNLFHRKLQFLLYLAAFQVSSVVFTGQGKVGSENGVTPSTFQLSQRADFLETLTAPWTTYRRPIVNSRDEPLCGRWRPMGGIADPTEEMARLHVIFFDSTLSPVATLLKVGVMQIVLSMIEAERINRDLLLEDPLEAVLRFSHDSGLQATALTASGRMMTAVELQWLFLEEARRFIAEGGCDGFVPGAARILELWESTLVLLERRDLPRLARRLDWALKLWILERARAQRPELGWDSPEIKHLDHLYSSLDDGLFWQYEGSDFVERVVTEDEIAGFVSDPPGDTRAWTRAMLLRRAGADAVDDVDWDQVRLRMLDERSWSAYRTVDLANPLAWTRKAAESVFDSGVGLDAIVAGLERLSRAPAGAAPPIAVGLSEWREGSDGTP